MPERVLVIGAGLAGAEAAWVLIRHGIEVEIAEMRPAVMTEAHSTGLFAELVCSNSLKGTDPLTAHGLLKAEMEILDSIVLDAAYVTRVPAGKALAVDRERFAQYITEKIENHPLVGVIREEIKAIPTGRPAIVATGPLTSDLMTRNISCITGSKGLFFYDAIAPIIDAESIDYSKAFFSSRWSETNKDYLNCPMSEQEYDVFLNAILTEAKVEKHEFEEARFFESCLPVEVITERGKESLRYGPMRPVGIIDPATGKRPYAIVQLRKENLRGDAYNMVGFQTRLKYPSQDRVFTLIPGLRNARFLRYGSIHRNTFIDSPRVLNMDLSLKGCKDVFMAGQITGVEGYVESACSGIVAGLSMIAHIRGKPFTPVPPETATGALMAHITDDTIKDFQPMNINYGIIPVPDVAKENKKAAIRDTALEKIRTWLKDFSRQIT